MINHNNTTKNKSLILTVKTKYQKFKYTLNKQSPNCITLSDL